MPDCKEHEGSLPPRDNSQSQDATIVDGTNTNTNNLTASLAVMKVGDGAAVGVGDNFSVRGVEGVDIKGEDTGTRGDEKNGSDVGAKLTAEEIARAKKTAKNKKKKESARKNKQLKEAEQLENARAITLSSKEIAAMIVKERQEVEKSLECRCAQAKEDWLSDRAFEVKISPGKGLGLFATRFIREGNEIFREASLLPSAGSNSWLRKEASFTLATPSQQARYMSLHAQCNCHEDLCLETRFMQIWDVNSFEVDLTGGFNFSLSNHNKNCNMVYEFGSRINHACSPNAKYGFTKDKLVVIMATKNINAGEEITHDYIGASVGGDRELRRTMLQQKYGFLCRCRACMQNTSVKFNENFIFQAGKSEDDREGVEAINRHTELEIAVERKLANWGRSMASATTEAEYQISRQFAPLIRRAREEDGSYRKINHLLIKHALNWWGNLLGTFNECGLGVTVIAGHIDRLRKKFTMLVGMMPEQDPGKLLRTMFQVFLQSVA